MTVASYVGPSDEKKYARRKLQEARSVIKSFPILRSISNDFKLLAHRLVRNNDNSLFLIAASSTPKNQSVINLDYALRHFRFKSWDRKAKDDFARRLVSPREDNSWSPFCEMNVALRLEQRYGKGNVRVYPSLPGPDIEARIHNRHVLFEVTGVFPGMTEDRLTRICRGIAKGLHQRIRGSRYLRIEIQTDKLPKDKKERFRIQPSISKVLDSFDTLGLSAIVPKFGSFRLRDASDYIMYTTGYKSIPQLRKSYLKGLERGFHSKAFKTFIRSLDESALKDSPITYFITGRARYRITEAACESIFPSKPAEDEQDAFLDRVERRILSKLNKPKQIVPGKPNVLVVNAANWTIRRYDFSSSLYDWQYEFAPVRKRLRHLLNENRPPNLSAIMMYENDFRDARIMENRFARKESALTTYEGMCLFSKKRISQLRKLKEAERPRRKVIHSKLIDAERSVVAGYDANSEIKELAFARGYDASTDSGIPFVQIPEVFVVPKAWFRDPRFSADFGESGRVVGIREVVYLVKRILEESEEVNLQVFDYETLCDTIDRFSSNVGSPTVIFVPLTLHLPVHNWIPQNRQRVLKWENGKTILLSKSGLEIPIHWLTRRDPDSQIIIYKRKVHGEWIVKPGNTTKELTLQSSIRKKDNIRVIAKTVVAYRTLNKNAAWRLSIPSRPQPSA